MRALIVTGGDAPPSELLLREAEGADLVVCCDRGALYARRAGLRPDVILGDMDSLEDPEAYRMPGVTFMELPREKDDTDTLYAADWCAKEGYGELTILGAIGSRLDHTLANVFLLLRMLKKGVKAELLDGHNRVFAAGPGIARLPGEPGQTVSLLPLDGPVRVKETRGLFYPIMEGTLPPEYPYGVSNVITGLPAEVEIESGHLAVFLVRE
ncbi:thiamine diphosphokinase [Gehongia tenuis]|uniref:Thiamine diphosphokinase n=1 Tax=Gehongia tenuis TaxID=2763655 RepID=A0A926D3P2_9FIRM|nr:thiamine diphosphokinase [Gehongia tenuis]MBC8530772.1 thiamine diphosphokinase [Gehongia tenuis]